MHNIRTIFLREYLERVRTKAFLITTIITPLLFAAMIGLPMFFATRAAAKHQRVAVAEAGPNAGVLFPLMKQRQSAGERAAGDPAAVPASNEATNRRMQRTARQNLELSSVLVPAGGEADTRQRLQGDVLNDRLDAFVWVEGDPVSITRVEYNARSVTDFAGMRALQDLISSAMIELRLRSRGIATTDVEALVKPIGLKTVRLSQTGAREDKGAGFITSYFFVLLLYITLILYGVAVMRSVIEEKASRVFEVLLSTVRPIELMAGKILGVAAVGLTQYLAWCLLALLAGGGIGIAALSSQFGELSVPFQTLFFLVVYFVLGYLLYSTMFAALGATVNSEQEAQQLQMIIMQFLILPMLMMPLILRDPSGTAATVLSLIPVFTPILMLMRITLVPPPAWQLALSIVLLCVTIAGVMWVSARIYRIGILMYGKRPTLPELLRWVRAS